MNWIIVTAGGNGERMNLHYNKIFVLLKGQPLIVWTLKSLHRSKTIDKIVISVKTNDRKKVESLVKKHNFHKVKYVLTSRENRQESTSAILDFLKDKVYKKDLLGVHNAVNPFVSIEELQQVYAEAGRYGAALLAQPAKDTVKLTDDNEIVEKTPIRKFCWYAQTPQVSSYGNLLQAFSQAKKDNFLGTDDTQLLERIGIKVKVVPCSNLNFKITFPQDVFVAEEILNSYLFKI